MHNPCPPAYKVGIQFHHKHPVLYYDLFILFYFIIQFYYLVSPQKFITVLCSPIQADPPVYSHLSPNLTLLFLHPLEFCVLLAESRLPDPSHLMGACAELGGTGVGVGLGVC